MGEAVSRQLFRFGTFEVDCQTGELHKSGRRISVQDKPFQVLGLLLEHPGELGEPRTVRNTDLARRHGIVSGKPKVGSTKIA